MTITCSVKEESRRVDVSSILGSVCEALHLGGRALLPAINLALSVW